MCVGEGLAPPEKNAKIQVFTAARSLATLKDGTRRWFIDTLEPFLCRKGFEFFHKNSQENSPYILLKNLFFCVILFLCYTFCFFEKRCAYEKNRL